MKVRLLHPEHDADLTSQLPWQIDALITDDLELNRIYDAMAAGDKFLLETAKTVLPHMITDPEVIIYRQQVLADTLANRSLVQQIYDIAAGVDGIELRHKVFLGGLKSKDPAAILRRSVRIMELLTDTLRQLRNLTDPIRRPIPLPRLSATLRHARRTDPRQLPRACRRLPLRIPAATRRAAELPTRTRQHRRTPYAAPTTSTHVGWAASPIAPATATNSPSTPDDLYRCGSSHQARRPRHQRHRQHRHPIGRAPPTLLQSAAMELAFYLGCANLHDELTKRNVPTCFPVPDPGRATPISTASVCATSDCAWPPATTFTGNTIDADGKALTVITGANERRQVDFSAQRRCRTADDASRNVRHRRSFHRQRPTRRLHSLSPAKKTPP